MRRTLMLFLAAMLAADAARAAGITYSDGICEYRVAYDDKTVDGRQLKASFDYLAGNEAAIELPPPLATAEDVAAIDLPRYRRRCADHHHRRLAAPALIARPGLDELRRREVEDLDAACARTEALLAPAAGDVTPARAHAPACSRYADLLALPAPELKAQWNDPVMDFCQASTQQHLCAGELQRQGEGPGSEARRRLTVLDRWSECATKPEKASDDEKQELLKKLARHFKAKVTSCAR